MPRTFVLSFVAVLALLLTAACGSSNDDATSTGSTSTTPAASMTTPAATGSGTETTAGTPGTDATMDADATMPANATMPADATMPGGVSGAQLGVIGVCFESNTDAAMIEDLRAGDTTSAEEVYTACLEDMLPPSIVADLEPVIEQAADCGTIAAEDLTDDDIAAIESGNRATIEQVSVDTLECLSTELGIPLL